MHSKEDSSGVSAEPSRPASPGQMLRAAREAKGVHLAVLSVLLKVPTRQLEALENDQYEAFKGTPFLRALAQTVCRHLGVDPAPVLAGLPKSAATWSAASRATQPVVASNAPSWGGGRSLVKGLSRWVQGLAVLMLVGAAALIWWPQPQQDAPDDSALPPQAAPVVPSIEQASDAAEASAPVASAAQATAAPAAPIQPTVPAISTTNTPVNATTVQPVQDTASPPASPLLIRASADAWISVRDSRGQIVLNRRVKSGESLKLDMAPPLFVYAGRADGIELTWRGQAVDLQPHTQNNEIRLFIKP